MVVVVSLGRCVRGWRFIALLVGLCARVGCLGARLVEGWEGKKRWNRKDLKTGFVLVLRCVACRCEEGVFGRGGRGVMD